MQLAWKEMKHYKKNYILIECTIILMIFMVIFLSGLTNGLGRAVSAAIENSNADFFAISEDAQNVIAASSLTQKQVNELIKHKSGAVSPLNIQRAYVKQKNSTEKLDITYLAIDTGSFLSPEVTDGAKLSSGEHEIVLNDTYKEDGISVGDVVEDTASGIQLTVVGFTKGAFYGHVSAGYISFDTFNNIRKSSNPNYVLAYNVVAIQGQAQGGLNVSGVNIVNKDTIVNNLPGYEAEQTTIQMIIWVLIVITGAILGVFFYILTIQKQKQFGVMKAIGMKTKQIAGVLISQIMALSVTGVIFGTLLAYGLSKVLPSNMPFFFQGKDALVISMAFVAISVFGGILSIFRVGQVDPIITIGGNEQ
ncbi:LOW QUALITY PROTEIN: protein of unknown function DUF214 [Ruminiclostridium papyrosolvens DSM 2782]|uniref:Putative hemin transport system permease protein HrtB n=2 Tax=Ruminiclostridium papyrosolvens TaxID=29362 RepID=F1TBQ9_9FIRM|nr:ABC transporter permease [Ruminiclostridium papyrosolvens]EGD48080.1 LOW QUALITY PROTEIN: protein of unknown function DUF214 [Ruminiclostridium papyrosolvens DSM 2782]WES35036.1 ABC transporter permease [Ruminiclostridium papyrosolvens DSM 2782]